MTKRKRLENVKKFDYEESDDTDEDEGESLLSIQQRLLRSKRNRPKSPTPSADLSQSYTVQKNRILFFLGQNSKTHAHAHVRRLS